MVKPVRVRFVVEPTSLKELEKLFDKFKLNWDDKVFKKVDDLSDSLDKLQKTMHDVWYQNAHQNLRNIQNPASGNADLQKLIDQMVKEFETQTKTLVTSIEKTTQAIDKLELGAGKAADGMMSFDQKMDLMEKSTQKELMAIEARERWHLKIKEKAMEQAKFEEEGRKQRQASRGWMNMFGGSGSIGGQLTKILEPLVQGVVSPMENMFKLEEFQKTKEGQKAEHLRYAQGGAPLNKMQGLGMYKDAGIDDPDKARKGGSGIFGRLGKFIGGRAQAGKKGGLAGMLGGAKGMAIAGGAMIGIKLLQKAITLGIQSSPMMQQMLKLWKFGIMMIFRPIGDFFGFFLRPIFVALLRKFIIPFYQTYLPMMQEMGHRLGEDVANNLIWILEMLSGIRYVTDAGYRQQVNAAGRAEAHAGTMHADLSSLITTEEAGIRSGYSYSGEERIDSPDHGRYATEDSIVAQTTTMKEELQKSIDQNRSWWNESGLLGEDMPTWLKEGLGGLEIGSTINNVNNQDQSTTVNQTNNIDITVNTDDFDAGDGEDLATTITHQQKKDQKDLWKSGGT